MHRGVTQLVVGHLLNGVFDCEQTTHSPARWTVSSRLLQRRYVTVRRAADKVCKMWRGIQYG